MQNTEYWLPTKNGITTMKSHVKGMRSIDVKENKGTGLVEGANIIFMLDARVTNG